MMSVSEATAPVATHPKKHTPAPPESEPEAPEDLAFSHRDQNATVLFATDFSRW